MKSLNPRAVFRQRSAARSGHNPVRSIRQVALGQNLSRLRQFLNNIPSPRRMTNWSFHPSNIASKQIKAHRGEIMGPTGQKFAAEVLKIYSDKNLNKKNRAAKYRNIINKYIISEKVHVDAKIINKEDFSYKIFEAIHSDITSKNKSNKTADLIRRDRNRHDAQWESITDEYIKSWEAHDTDGDSCTLLHLLIEENCSECLEVANDLVKILGANSNIKLPNGDGALHKIVNSGTCKNVLKHMDLLIQNGADPKAKNDLNYTPLDLILVKILSSYENIDDLDISKINKLIVHGECHSTLLENGYLEKAIEEKKYNGSVIPPERLKILKDIYSYLKEGKKIPPIALFTPEIFPPTRGCHSKISALALLDNYKTKEFGIENISLLFLKTNSPNVRKIAKKYSSVQGEVLQREDFCNIAKKMGYQTSILHCPNLDIFRKTIYKCLEEKNPPIVVFPVDPNGYPRTERNPPEWSEHGAVISGFDPITSMITIAHWGRTDQVSLDQLYNSMQQLKSTRSQDKKSIVPTEGSGFKNCLFLFTPDLSDPRWKGK